MERWFAISTVLKRVCSRLRVDSGERSFDLKVREEESCWTKEPDGYVQKFTTSPAVTSVAGV
jgi:hypothetical protein